MLTEDKKTELWDWKVIEWFRQSNSRVIKRFAIIFSPRRKREDRSQRSCGSSS